MEATDPIPPHHLVTAIEHGFNYDVTGAPLIIADGLCGENLDEIQIDKRHFNSVKIAGGIARADSMIVLSHFKGHMLSGFGGLSRIWLWDAPQLQGKLICIWPNRYSDPSYALDAVDAQRSVRPQL